MERRHLSPAALCPPFGRYHQMVEVRGAGRLLFVSGQLGMDPEGRLPWLDWRVWLAANGAADVKPAGALRFSLYDQVIQAAVAGQGVALGRLPLIGDLA